MGASLKILLLAGSVLLWLPEGLSQEYSEGNLKQGLVFEANGFAGKQIKIYPNYPDNNITAYAELHAGYKCYGTKAWHRAWRYPQIGVSFMYGFLGNKEVLGSSYSLIPDITFESRDDRKVPVDVRLGTGLACFSKPYDRLENPENLVIGSRMANVTYLSVNYRKVLNRYFSLWAGLSMVHFSNGHYQLPNIGLNTFTLNAGIKVYPYGKPVIKHTEGQEPEIDHRLKANIRIGFGVNEFGSATKPIGGPKYPVYIATAYASKRVGQISNLQAGVFLTYYSGFYDYIIDQDFYGKNQRVKSSVVSLFIGNEFLLGRFGLLWQSGINVYNPFQREYFKMNYGSGTTAKMKTWWCNKLGAQFYLLKPERQNRFNVWLGVYIKSNLMTADFVESCVGITF